jgi:hypothetical protein
MSIPTVFGTRVKETAAGAVGVNCPYCGELTVADCFDVATAGHVYLIHGAFQHAGSFIKCRVCGVPQEMPPGAIPHKLDATDETRPSPGFLNATNPALAAATDCSPVPLAEELPPSVSRKEWALAVGILAEIHRQDADDKVSGNINPLYILSLMGAAGGFIAVWMELAPERKPVAFTLLALGTCAVLFLIHRFHKFLLNRALHREVGACVRRHIAHTGTHVQSLIAAADALGADWRPVAEYLRWACSRMQD